ncbi:hypothetical protein NE237_007886 [Protea cynaroides]|uniref:Uncharacterized protein n=1 Tax=Protea cynaroides TaxID=273540 RepID=A0A9Q0QWU0_9MAGN|nr:hypothetical protein NE237_007886 [Protea cynaroides]
MDALPPHHRFMRAPPSQQQPPPMADPQLRPSPLQGPWYSSQFQYHTSQVPPPPPQQTPWVTHSDHHHIPPAYPLQPHQHAAPLYPPAHPHNNHYLPPPPPRSHLPPPPPRSHLPHSHPNGPQVPQPYPPSEQTWGNSSWAHHQAWEYSDRNISHSNDEDWAAKAREWAAAKAAMENQHSQSQFPPSGRPEEHSNVYHDQYQQTVDPHYIEMQQSSLPAWSHQQFPVSATNLHRPPVNHLQDSTSFGSGQPSYVSDGHISYTARDGALLADSDPVFAHQGSASTSSSIYQQEVPSSYSSVQGTEETAEVQQQSLFPKSSVQEGQHHLQPMLPAIGRTSSAEHPHFTYENQITDATADPSDLPLDFVPRFTRENDPHPQAGYTHPDSSGHVGSMVPIAAVSSMHAWTSPAATGVAYPPVSSVPPGAQFDPSFVAPSVTGHSAPIFGRIPGPSFRPPIPTVGASFGIGAGAAIHPTRAFPGDANGVLNISERPKKASVPNWLREEIIKKAVIPSSIQEHPEEDPLQSVGDDSVDRSYKKSDQADNRSVDSFRSTEDEDDDEDDVEAARTAAINQEIKRVLTEILLKVTDELFDEIATKVISEDLSVEVNRGSSPQDHKVLPSSPAVPTLVASAKGLLPVKAKEAEDDDVSGKSSSSPPGDVLGLASYASDDDDENQSSSVPESKQTNTQHQQLTNGKLAEDVRDSVKNGSSKIEGPTGGRMDIESDQKGTGQHEALENGLGGVLDHENDGTSAVRVVGEDKINTDGEKMVHSDAFESKDAVGGRETMKPEQLPVKSNSKKSVANDFHGGEARNKSDKSHGHDGRGSVGKDFVKEGETNKTKTHDKHPDSADTKRRDERHARKEKADNRSALKERLKDRGAKSDEKARESDSRKSSHVNSKDDRKETEKTRRASGKEDSNRKKERARDERGDRSKPKTERDSSRHKRRRSSSVSSRGRNSKDISVGVHYSDSSDEVSEGSSERKMHTKRRSLSPSPTRTRRRQVSRSPHSKHSQRRHSPYSSLETTRGKRSRSNSPVRRRR